MAIATPEHWHAPMAIMALQSGKHVYVEKPASHNPYETELLIQAQRKYGKKVQVGTQQRSAWTSIQAVKEIKEGIIGDVYKGEAYYSNNRGSIGVGKVIPVPSTLDWNLWQGPAPRTSYRDNVHPYNWHWFRIWGTGEVHNNGTHEIDVCRWALGVKFPEKVTSTGGKFTYQDDWQYPDYQQITYDFQGGKSITWVGHSRGIIKPSMPGRGATIYGSKGVIELSREGYKLYKLNGELINTESETGKNSASTNTRGGGQLDVAHTGNFLDAITKGDKLNAPIAEAGITTQLCHFGNITQSVGSPVHISPEGKIIKNSKAVRTFWKRDYEKGWEPKL